MVAALRSPRGASAALLVRALERRFTPVLSAALVVRYEEVRACVRTIEPGRDFATVAERFAVPTGSPGRALRRIGTP